MSLWAKIRPKNIEHMATSFTVTESVKISLAISKINKLPEIASGRKTGKLPNKIVHATSTTGKKSRSESVNK
ncbi:hypothetical protein Dfri01_18350 [Dyadobacter frigoris]|nr:hypothetical protein Dfri01_18350 [Dyadobacter frigoris]